ncbi:MAG: YihY/virulence factor BrkB family protein [Sphingomonadales bacterium]|nr:YihY/virulence factor BrkB family protein [Sphingomonadales bacterium]
MTFLGRWFRHIFDSFNHFFDDDGFALAGNMAFLGMLSFFPFLIFLITLSGLLGQTANGQEAINLILANLPAEVADTIDGPINAIVRGTRNDVLTFSILFSLWTAASGVEATRTAVLRAYKGVYNPSIWRRRLESLAIVFVAAVFILLGMALLVLGPMLIDALESLLPVPLPDDTQDIWALFQYGVGPGALFTALFGLYLTLSPRRAKGPICMPGALMALMVWLLTASVFSTYLQLVGGLNLTYGALAGVVIAQIFFYIVSIGFILGAELNASVTRSIDHIADD